MHADHAVLLFTHSLELEEEEDLNAYTYALFFNFEANQLYTF
jgi:hypothetical protein